ncbi:MAG: hypothetical protein COT91_04580 [Candidatus Doudnabacteria bacterium CG10_big_fil_rev_8_21_14_0_10_41_10]|uniref:Uncharacterized protein n=1 Tax=Candidatus Doudnabacteria bacterium CG10_big_fil_rev_8_21_14_0_10_41_10 TaxID=1974551 RepID=A0A2H0VCJ8_9BACT|nr:MAG: hypothetical protein COT91_04580 [Candidatus Doudnabacteria bacterium CG10_big_fil_rev_8_21_14_0_10_41_10]
MNNDLITIISLLIGLLGLVATLVGTYLSYISFVNPLKRFNKYLKNPENWEKFQGIEAHLSFYRHKKYPNFQIVIDWDKELVENFHEEWMNDALYPDKTNNASYYVRLEANGMLLDKELFVSLDGHRYFVPVPRVSISKTKTDERDFYYDTRQIQLANIVGKYHFGDKGIYDFAKSQSKPIEIRG